MSPPITWRNVNSKSNADAAYLMRGAQQGITSGMGQIADVLKAGQKTAQDNYNIIKENNNNDFRNMLSGFRSEDELNAAVESGAIQRQADSYGRQSDPNLMRNGVKERGDALRDKLTAEQAYLTEQQTFADAQDKLTLRPVLDQLAMAQSGTTPEDDARYAKIYNANEAEINRLGLGAGLSEKWNQSLISENELRLKQEKEEDAAVVRQSNQNFEAAIAQMIPQVGYDENNFPDITLGRAMINDALANGEFGQMTNADQRRLVRVFGERLAESSGITPDQLKTAEAARSQATIVADRDLEQARITRDEVLATNQVDKQFSFTDADRSAMELALKAGWDKDGLGKDIERVRELFLQSTVVDGKQTVSGIEADNLMALAMPTLGEESHFFGTDADDLPEDRLFDKMRSLLKEYQQDNENRKTRVNANKTYVEAEAKARDFPDTTYSERMARFRQNNVNQENIVSAKKSATPKVTP